MTVRCVNREKLKERLIDEMAEKTLVYGMKFMGLYAMLSPEFAKDLDNFAATYQFIKYPDSVGKTITVVVKFQGRHVKVSKKRIPEGEATITVFFRDGRVILDYLLGKDIFKKVIAGDVVVSGNVNYLNKLGYLANHLRGKCRLPR